MSINFEPCAGCGEMSNSHPMIGITKDEGGEMAAFPVCGLCWKNPSHRKARLKMHFFDATQAKLALDYAGSEHIG